MDSPSRGYDYTEGASASDIDAAAKSARRVRRDSEYSASAGVEEESGTSVSAGGSMFAGPGSLAVPSSVSRMSHGERGLQGRRSAEWARSRRRSHDSGAGVGEEGAGGWLGRRTSIDSQAVLDFESDDGHERDEREDERHDEREELSSLRRTSSRRKSISPEATRSGVFDNLAHLFGGKSVVGEPSSGRARRPSLSNRSSVSSRRSSRRSDAGSDYAGESDGGGDDRWGYASGEEDESESEQSARGEISDGGPSDLDYGSYPPSPTASLPLLSSDPLFGDEARIDMDGLPLEPRTPPPPGPPSRQNIYVPEEDTTVLFVGFELTREREWAWRAACVLTCGALALVGHWFPRFWLRWVAQEKAFKDTKNGFVVIETTFRDVSLFPMRLIEYPYPVSTVFPSRPALASRRPSVSSSTFKANGAATGDEESGRLQYLTAVDYRYSRFVLDPRTGLFSMLRDWRDPTWDGLSSVQNGLDGTTQQQRLVLFGKNEIDIQAKSVLTLLVDEVIHPFYVFQIASIILWSLDDYYYYAFCIALISAVSIATTLIETRKTIQRMREMSRFSCEVDVFASGSWVKRDSTSLVPGDVVNLSSSHVSIVPADMFLLAGDAIVNESMLTGESVPVSKVPVGDAELAKWRDAPDVQGDAAKSFLYFGTKVVRIRGALSAAGFGGSPALALVVRSGFSTTKGALVRSMLFPKPMGFQFYRDSMRFIGVLACIAGLGFCVSAVQFIRLGIKWHTILLRALDLITVVVPPALPATLSIGTSFALSRLRKLGIFCISPSRVNVAGKINLCCFDKTGTLTEDGLDILGVRSLDRSAHRFGELLEDVHDLPTVPPKENASFLHALATCHSLKTVDDELIGDPLDVKMFQFTRWTLEEGIVAGTGKIKSRAGEERPAALVQTVVRPPGSTHFRLEDALKSGSRRAHFLELGVIRTFEFVSALRRMSVIVKRLRSTSMEVYVKGAPEVMADICESDSFPEDYDDLLSYYTGRGYRVIAIAGKSIEGLSWLKAQRMKREQAESGLRFLGLVIFENKLKPGTGPAIQALRSAHLPCRMITGDNPLTAVSVARECGLVNQAAHVFSPRFIIGGPMIPMSKLEWSDMDDFAWKLDDYSLKPLDPPPHHTVDPSELEYQDYALVVTGDVFRWMINHAPLETLQRMLVKAHIFARMSPDEKNEVVERLQALGYTVLMCGDGANDCAALKAADVGISLSEAEASVAAPFTSAQPDIACVLDVIKEGRAALVTSFSCFKYMALYSLIQFTSITLLYSFASSLGDFQFLYIDLFIIIPIAVTMGRTLPYPLIYQKRPTASLVSKKVLASIIGQIIITSAVQFWAFFWVRGQEWYSPPGSDPNVDPGDKLPATNYENSSLFLVSCFQYILVAAVFSIGPPYRKAIWTNGWLMFSLIVLSLFNLMVLLLPPQSVVVVLELMTLPSAARLTLLFAVIINVVVSTAFERWGSQAVAQLLGTLSHLRRGSKRRHREGKTYKAVEGGMR